MASIASFSVAHENGQCQYSQTSKNLYIPGFKGIMEKNEVKKKFSRQVAVILIIDGKLKI